MVNYSHEPNDRFHRAAVKFSQENGVAALQGYEGESVRRWLLSGSLSDEQKKQLSDIYERNK